MAACLILLLLLPGCVNENHPYPPTWARITARGDQGCVPIDGRYSNSGDTSAGKAWSPVNPPLLARLVLGAWWEWRPAESTRGYTGATHVDLKSPAAGRLDVTVWSGETLIRRATVTTSIKCTEDGLLTVTQLVPDQRRAAAGTGAAVFVDRDAIALAKAEDGALILQRTTTNFGLLILVPVYARQRTWARYAELPTPPRASLR